MVGICQLTHLNLNKLKTSTMHIKENSNETCLEAGNYEMKITNNSIQFKS